LNTVSYFFSDGINAFFDLPTEHARRLLPRHLEPLERQHGTSILSVAGFDFFDSPIGPYREAVLSIVVAPLVAPSSPVPKAALYPYLVTTTTRSSREHAIERWRLPHWMEDTQIDFVREPGRIMLRVGLDDVEVLRLTVTEHDFAAASDLYQVFVRDEMMSDVVMSGKFSEHEAEKGSLTLREHRFYGELAVSEVEPLPFREQWIRAGTETFHPLVALPGSRVRTS